VTTAAAILLLSSLSPATAERYARLIDAEATRHQLNPLLMVALIHRESRFQRRAYSRGNWGLFQVRVSHTTNRHLVGNEHVLFSPRVNIRIGAAMLAYWRRYHRRYCAGRKPHHWWSHYQHGRVVRDRRSGDRVAVSLSRISKHPSRASNVPISLD
jgi:hypothetical protein